MIDPFTTPDGPLRIKEAFDRKFGEVGIFLPDEAVATGAPGSLRRPGGSQMVRYVFGLTDGKPHLELYWFDRIWGDLHQRIHADGEIEHLAVLQTQYIVGKTPEEDERARAAMQEHNRKLLEDLDAVGLGSGGPVPTSFVMNAYLTTGDRDQDPTS